MDCIMTNSLLCFLLTVGENHPKPPPLIFPPQNTNYNVVGYMPLRGDFDIEYENDAELILADIEFRGKRK